MGTELAWSGYNIRGTKAIGLPEYHLVDSNADFEILITYPVPIIQADLSSCDYEDKRD